MSGQHQPDRRRRALAFAAFLALALLAGCSGGSKPSALTDPPSSTTGTATTATPTTVRQPAGNGPRQPTGTPVTLAFGGDVHFEGVIRSRLESNPATALGPISSVLREADLAMVNLETAVTTGGAPTGKEFNFRAPPSAFRALQGAGVDVATMANNHGEDYGVAGLRDSLAAAEAAHFPVVGIGRDATQAFGAHAATVKGQRIAVIGATQVLDSSLAAAWSAGPGKPGLASAYQESRLLAAVRTVRRTSDTVVVFLHWGEEGGTCPISRQRALAPRLVAAGADVVVGSHAPTSATGSATSSSTPVAASAPSRACSPSRCRAGRSPAPAGRRRASREASRSRWAAPRPSVRRRRGAPCGAARACRRLPDHGPLPPGGPSA